MPDMIEFPRNERWKVADAEFEMGVVEASEHFRALYREMTEAGKEQKDYLDGVIAFVADHGGPTLTYDEAEWLYHHVEVLREQKKSQYRDAIASTQRSRSFTESTRAE